MKSYTALTEEGEFSHEIEINRSRFIATAKNVSSAEQAEAFVRAVAQRFGDATHNCYAYVIGSEGSEQRFSDDGEPQGTAGMPILGVIKKQGLSCTAVVVTRYFGGIKLGAGGLVGAYARVTSECLDKIPRIVYRYSVQYLIKCDYGCYNRLEKLLKEGESLSVLGREYGDGVELKVSVPEEEADTFVSKLNDAAKGEVDISELCKQYYHYKI